MSRGGGDDQRVEDLVVAEYRWARVRALRGVAEIHFGASIQMSSTTVPASAPAQTAISSAVASGPSITSSANGVTVPAISRKIIVWSRRRIQRRTAGRSHCTR